MLTRPGVSTAADDVHDATPTRLVRVLDPLSGSAKPEWRPPTYEKKTKRVTSEESTTSASSSRSHTYVRRPTRTYASPTPKSHAITMDVDGSSDFCLTDDEADIPKPPSRPRNREELEEKMWDSAITNAIDKLIGVVDLR